MATGNVSWQWCGSEGNVSWHVRAGPVRPQPLTPGSPVEYAAVDCQMANGKVKTLFEALCILFSYNEASQ